MLLNVAEYGLSEKSEEIEHYILGPATSRYTCCFHSYSLISPSLTNANKLPVVSIGNRERERKNKKNLDNTANDSRSHCMSSAVSVYGSTMKPAM